MIDIEEPIKFNFKNVIWHVKPYSESYCVIDNPNVPVDGMGNGYKIWGFVDCYDNPPQELVTATNLWMNNSCGMELNDFLAQTLE